MRSTITANCDNDPAEDAYPEAVRRGEHGERLVEIHRPPVGRDEAQYGRHDGGREFAADPEQVSRRLRVVGHEGGVMVGREDGLIGPGIDQEIDIDRPAVRIRDLPVEQRLRDTVIVHLPAASDKHQITGRVEGRK